MFFNGYFEIKNEYGYALIKYNEEELDGLAYLDVITIEDKYQGMGFGGRLLEEVLDWAFESEYSKIIVHARPLVDDNRKEDLIRFYEKHGFKKSEDYVAFVGTYMEIDL